MSLEIPLLSLALDNPAEAAQIGRELQERWLEAETTPGIFRYKLNLQKERTLEGHYGFFAQLNLERGVLRRAPLPMNGLKPVVDSKTFNFTRVRPEEKLMDIRFRDYGVAVLINNSPITKFHCLLVPRLGEQLPQVLTHETIDFTIRLLWQLNCEVYKIGYNSPGAAASVNHLHLHLIHLENEIFAQRAELEEITTDVYSLSNNYSIKGICFILRRSSDGLGEAKVSEKLNKLVQFMIDHGIPHNLLFVLTKDTRNSGDLVMRILIYPRGKICILKSTTDLNIACFEFSGYFPVASQSLYDELTESTFFKAAQEQQGDILERIVAKIQDPDF